MKNKHLTKEVSELSASVDKLKVETKKNQIKNEKLEAHKKKNRDARILSFLTLMNR